MRLFGVKWLQGYGERGKTLMSPTSPGAQAKLWADVDLPCDIVCAVWTWRQSWKQSRRGRKLISPGLWHPDGWGPSSGRTCTVWLWQLPRLSPLTDHGRCSPSLGHSEHVAHSGGPSNFPQAPTCPCKTHLVIFNYWQQQEHVVFIYLYNLRISVWFMDYINLVCLEVSYIYTNRVCFKSFLINEYCVLWTFLQSKPWISYMLKRLNF